LLTTASICGACGSGPTHKGGSAMRFRIFMAPFCAPAGQNRPPPSPATWRRSSSSTTSATTRRGSAAPLVRHRDHRARDHRPARPARHIKLGTGVLSPYHNPLWVADRAFTSPGQVHARTRPRGAAVRR
jgi:hypothetical protein